MKFSTIPFPDEIQHNPVSCLIRDTMDDIQPEDAVAGRPARQWVDFRPGQGRFRVGNVRFDHKALL